MQKRRVLIIGASGFLGKELYKVFKTDQENYETYGTYSKNSVRDLKRLDVTDLENMKIIFREIKPNIVIITVALTNVEYCEVYKEEAYKINVNGLKNIAELCKVYDSKAVYVSTDYVFDGVNGPYSEDNIPEPINYYGQTKLEGEKIISAMLEDHIIARTTVVYGWDPESKNFIMQLIKTLGENKTMKVPVDQVSSPTYCPNLAQMIKESCDKNLIGIYNMAGNEVMDRYTFARKAATIFGLNPDLIAPVETRALGQVAKRPLNAGLKVDKISVSLMNKPVGVTEGLTKVQSLYMKYMAKV